MEKKSNALVTGIAPTLAISASATIAILEMSKVQGGHPTPLPVSQTNPIQMLFLFGDDFVFNFVVGRRGNDLLLDKIGFGAIRAAGNYLFGIRCPNPGQGIQFLLAGGVDVHQVRAHL